MLVIVVFVASFCCVAAVSIASSASKAAVALEFPVKSQGTPMEAANVLICSAVAASILPGVCTIAFNPFILVRTVLSWETPSSAFLIPSSRDFTVVIWEVICTLLASRSAFAVSSSFSACASFSVLSLFLEESSFFPSSSFVLFSASSALPSASFCLLSSSSFLFLSSSSWLSFSCCLDSSRSARESFSFSCPS